MTKQILKSPYYATTVGLNSPYLEYAKNYITQNGEDGIIEKLFFDLGIDSGTVVEFGAWDGVFISNVFLLWRYKNFNALLIEGDSSKATELKAKVQNFTNVEAVDAFVSEIPGHENSLDNIISRSNFDFSDDNFALLSVDVDSIDYQIWEAMLNYNPKVVIIESLVTYELENGVSANGSSIRSLTELANKKGYSLVCYNLNGIYVRNDMFAKLPKFDNSVDRLYVPQVVIESILQRLDENGKLIHKPYRYHTEEYHRIWMNEKHQLNNLITTK